MSPDATLPVLPPSSSWWLASIAEPRNNDLRVVVVEAGAEAQMSATQLGEAYKVHPSSTSRAFEIIWYHYVAYMVRNESYCVPEGEVDLRQSKLQSLSSSKFLSHVQSSTIATNEFPGQLTHWVLATDWHIVDVVSVQPPEMRELSGAEVQPYLTGLSGQSAPAT